MTLDPERARAVRRRRVHERQAVVFGVLLASLALAGLGAAAVYTDTIDVPLLARDFSTPSPTAGLDVVAPCPPAGAVPVPVQQVTVNVYNGSGRPGLAGSTLQDLQARGFVPGATGNTAEPVKGVGRISFGAAGVTSAYALWDHLDDVTLQLDDRADATVDLAIGETFVDLVALEEVLVDPALPLPTPTGCVPLEQMTPVPVVGPAPPDAEGAAAG